MNQKKIRSLLAAVAATVLAGGSAQAINITVADGIPSGGSGIGSEVGETEPGTVNNHSWDNEAFVVKGNKLVLIGGFNYLTGNSGFASGDIFINTIGSMPIGSTLPGGNGYQNITGNLGYEYVLDLDVAGGKFNVRNLTVNPNAVTLESGYYRQNDKGNPFRYLSGGLLLPGVGDRLLEMKTYTTTAALQAAYGADVTTSGELNYALELDMSWWNLGNNFDLHFTFGCDNDVIAGSSTSGFDRVPDGGSTMALLGLAMTGLVAVRRSRKS